MKRVSNIAIAVSGTALEVYDNTLYTLFAVILGPIFFPHEDPFVVYLSTFAALAAGFIARPIGGLFFSHIGDRLGRKKALSWSIILMIFPTFIIGILPSYASIGVLASILLVTCRLVQGFCVGGELGGAITFIIESAEPKHKGFYSSFMAVASYLGGIVGAAFGIFCLQPFMPSWGWRIPFIFGAFIGVLGYTIRRYLTETPAFVATQKQGKVLKYPLVNTLKYHKASMFRAMGIAAGVLVPFFIVTTYLNGILKLNLHFTSLDIMKLNLGLLTFWTCLSPLMGLLADRIGVSRLMAIASGTLVICSYPLFFFLENNIHSFEAILFVQLCLSTLCVAFAAPCSAYLASLFPTNERYSGISLGYTIGCAMLGGTAPLIATALLKWTGDQKAPAYYLLFCAIGAFLAVTTHPTDRSGRFFFLKKSALQ